MKNKKDYTIELVIGIILLAILESSCTKIQAADLGCDNVTFYSDKYTLDSVYVKTDIAMEERQVCGIDLERCKQANLAPPFKPCGLGLMEIHRYKIGNTYTKPKLFK